MRIFVLKALFFIFGISLSLNLLGRLADTIAPLEDWRFEFQQRNKSVEAKNDVIEAITLGNSHSDAIDYAILGIEGQSLAFAAADLFEIEKTTLFLDDKLPNLHTVFITISYYSFHRDNAQFESLRSRRIRFYSMVPTWSPIEGDLPNFLMGKFDSFTHVMSVVRSDSWKNVWLGLLSNTSPLDPFSYDGVRTASVWGECLHYTAEQLDTHAWEIARRNVSSSIQMTSAHPELEKDSYKALARTIERLQSRGTRVILFTPAYYEKYNLYFADGGSFMIDQLRQAVGNLQQTYGVEYYDFSHDRELTIHPEFFYNSDHLSECGHEVISAKLLEKMGKISPFER